MADTLSRVHFKTIFNELQGRFFSQKEADELKEAIDKATVTDPQIRAAAATCWPEGE